jgi:hypothetical protein
MSETLVPRGTDITRIPSLLEKRLKLAESNYICHIDLGVCTAQLSYRASGGMVIFPALGQYLTGAFNVSSNTVVYIEKDAAILGSTDGKDYPLIQPLPVIFAPWVPLINSYYTEAFGFAYNTSN